MVFNYQNKLLIYLVLSLCINTVIRADRSYYHQECGESPIFKFKELAKAIGKTIKKFFITKAVYIF